MSTMTQPAAAGLSANIARVAVIGGGTMGNGIAQTFATAGIDVELIDVKPEFVERAVSSITKNLDRVAKKQGWPAEQAPAILARIHGGTALDAARRCELTVEAVSEDMALKRTIFEQLDAAAPPQAILARGRAWPGRSRPLCPYPSHAHYKGMGNVDEAGSFECR